jgi:glycolate oxidase FAD binding subunit
MAAPEAAADLIDLIADATRGGSTLEIRGGGSKADIGAPRETTIVDMGRMSGVIDYDPAELVLTAWAGTPLSQIEALVASEGQMLAFEPYGAEGSTIGGVVAAGVAGSRRISAGGARDHLLGFQAVSGRGERFVAGAKVVKNVTGYDLPKLAAGSWGRLFAMTEVTLKVLPRGQTQATVAIEGLLPEAAQRAMARAMGSQADVQAAAHDPGAGLTAVRLEGFGPSVAARIAMVQALWAEHGATTLLGDDDAARFWGDLRSLASLADSRPLWRINTASSGGPKVVAALASLGARWLFDWAGGLTWLTLDGQAEAVRAAAREAGGHAMLVRADAAMRSVVPMLHPQSAGVAALEARVRRAFDPSGVFETGRFLDGSLVEVGRAD